MAAQIATRPEVDRQSADEVELYQAVSYLPPLLVDIDKLRSRNLFAKPNLESLAADIADYFTLIEVWQQNFSDQYFGQIYNEGASELYAQTSEATKGRAAYSTCFSFANLGCAHLQLLAWAATALLQTLLSFVCRHLRATLPDNENVVAFIRRMEDFNVDNPHELLRNIVRSVEHLTDLDSGLIAVQVLGFPLSIAQGCLHLLRSPDLQWFDLVLNRFSGRDDRIRGFAEDMAALGMRERSRGNIYT